MSIFRGKPAFLIALAVLAGGMLTYSNLFCAEHHEHLLHHHRDNDCGQSPRHMHAFLHMLSHTDQCCDTAADIIFDDSGYTLHQLFEDETAPADSEVSLILKHPPQLREFITQRDILHRHCTLTI